MAAGAVEVNITTNNSKPCAVFDGIDDYVEVPHAPQQLGANLSNGFTISAWVNPRSEGEGALAHIISKNTDSSAAAGFYMRVSATRKVQVRINAGTAADTGTAYSFGEWTHVLWTVTSAQLSNIYINGVQTGGANVDLVQGVATITTTNAMRIGNRATATDATFDGSIKDVKMWNRVLTTDEITRDYSGNRIPTEGLIHHFKLQSDYKDSGSVGADGTNSGTYLSIVDDAIASAIKADITTHNDKINIVGLPGGQVLSTIIEET